MFTDTPKLGKKKRKDTKLIAVFEYFNSNEQKLVIKVLKNALVSHNRPSNRLYLKVYGGRYINYLAWDDTAHGYR